MLRMPRGGAVGRRPASRLLAEGHDDLRLARVLQEGVEADDRGDDRGRVVAGDDAERGDDALEAGVHGLEAVAGRTAEDDGDVSLRLVLRNDDLVDAVAVEIDRHRDGLEGEKLAALD